MKHTNLSLLSDEELIRHGDNIRDPLTTSDLEIELIERLADREWSDVHAVLEDKGYDGGDAQILRNALELADAVESIFSEYDDVNNTDDIRSAIDRDQERTEILIEYGIENADQLRLALQALEDARAALSLSETTPA